MTATLLDITAGIKDVLATIQGLHASATEPANPVAPAAWPVLAALDYDTDFEGDPTYSFDIVVTVPSGTDLNRAQTSLLPFLDRRGGKSIPAAFDADPTLGDTVSSCRMLPRVQFGSIPVGDGTQLAARLGLEVLV